MSRIKEKTREVVRIGEEQRGTFAAQGVPLKMYMWWQRYSKHSIAKENFCHYWRVVFIWAPMMFVRLQIKKLLVSSLTWVGVSIVILALCFIYPASLGYYALIVLAAVGIIIGASLGVMIGINLTDGAIPEFVKNEKKRSLIVLGLIAIATLPAVIAGFVGNMLIDLLSGKHAKHFYRWTVEARLIAGHVSPLLALFAIAAGAMVYLSILGSWWWVSLTIFLLVVAWFVGRWGLEKFGYYIARQREAHQAREVARIQQERLIQLDPVLRVIFDHLHAEAKDSNDAYVKWRQRYVAFVESQRSSRVWSEIYDSAAVTRFPDYWQWDADLMFVAGRMLWDMHDSVPAPRTDSKRYENIKTPLTTTADFLVLIAQVIRVSKWKICPIVKLPEGA